MDAAYLKKCKSKKCRDCKGEFPVFRSDVSPCKDLDETAPPFRRVREGCSSKLFHLRGNVNEWLNEPNTAAGGSWRDKRAEILEKDTFRVETPNAWTGFRHVVEWKRWTGEQVYGSSKR